MLKHMHASSQFGFPIFLNKFVASKFREQNHTSPLSCINVANAQTQAHVFLWKTLNETMHFHVFLWKTRKKTLKPMWFCARRWRKKEYDIRDTCLYISAFSTKTQWQLRLHQRLPQNYIEQVIVLTLFHKILYKINTFTKTHTTKFYMTLYFRRRIWSGAHRCTLVSNWMEFVSRSRWNGTR